MPKNLQENLSSKLLCVIDIGSNSIRTNVYLLDGRQYNVIYKDRFFCNFTKGLSKTNNLSNTVIKKALKYTQELRSKLNGFKLYACIAVATSALRLAKNSRSFTSKAERILGTKIEIISGVREAELGVKGVGLEVGKLDGLVLDLGGGSLELSQVSNSRIQSMVSLELGHQVLAEKAKGGIDKLRSHIRKNLETINWLSKHKYKSVYLSGGKFRRLAKLHMKLTRGEAEGVNAYKINRKKLEELIIIKERNFKSKPEALLMYYSTILLDELIKMINANNFIFCRNSIREGILVEF